MITRIIPIIVCAVFILVSGLVHGLWSSRWYSSKALEQAVLKVPNVSLKFGDWIGNEIEVDPEIYAQAGAKSYWMRKYRHEKDGQLITAILMCGPSGQMAVHTPDICYRGAGYEMIGQQKRLAMQAGGAQCLFWSGTFRKGNALAAPDLHLYWSWSYNGDWQAPSAPRFAFGGKPVLYKLYLIRQVPITNHTDKNANNVDGFVKQLLPELKKTLFSGNAG